MTPPRQTDRAFGVTMAGALGVLSAVLWYAGGEWPDGLLIAAAAFLVAALAFPGILLPFNRLWQAFSGRLSKFSNLLILGAFFFLVVFPAGLILRLLGRDPMRRDVASGEASFWMPVERQTDAETLGDLF